MCFGIKLFIYTHPRSHFCLEHKLIPQTKSLFVAAKETHNLVALLMMSDDNREKKKSPSLKPVRRGTSNQPLWME